MFYFYFSFILIFIKICLNLKIFDEITWLMSLIKDYFVWFFEYNALSNAWYIVAMTLQLINISNNEQKKIKFHWLMIIVLERLSC
jgi:hypothetical protein